MQDEQLLEALIENPKEGIRILTEQYGGLVYTLTWRRLSGKLTKEDVEECVSDIFLELYQCRERIDLRRGTIKAFLLLIAERKAIKYYDRKAEPYEKVSIGSEEGAEEIPAADDVEQITLQKEQSRLLLQAIMDLGEPNSTIMIQKYYYGMTAKEIGKGFGMSKNAVEKRIKRGLKKLKELLGGDSYEG